MFEKLSDSSLVFEAENLVYNYPGNIPALREICFNITAGEIVALVGANGSGKSTLLKILDGLVFPSGGRLRAFGRSISENTFKDSEFNKKFRREVGFVFQNADVQLFSPTVWDEVTFGPLQEGLSRNEVISRASACLDLLNLTQLKERPPYFLSGGEKKKVALASVLSLQPSVLLLDEPTSGLDPWSQGHLIDFLLQWTTKDRTMVFSTQDLDLVEEIATRVIILNNQHVIVADGIPDKFLRDADFLLRMNLVHEHSHRHKEIIHRHPHQHEHKHH